MPSEGLSCGFGQDGFDVFFAERDFVVGQRRVHQERQGGAAQFDGVFQPLFGRHGVLSKAFSKYTSEQPP